MHGGIGVCERPYARYIEKVEAMLSMDVFDGGERIIQSHTVQSIAKRLATTARTFELFAGLLQN